MKDQIYWQTEHLLIHIENKILFWCLRRNEAVSRRIEALSNLFNREDVLLVAFVCEDDDEDFFSRSRISSRFWINWLNKSRRRFSFSFRNCLQQNQSLTKIRRFLFSYLFAGERFESSLFDQKKKKTDSFAFQSTQSYFERPRLLVEFDEFIPWSWRHFLKKQSNEIEQMHTNHVKRGGKKTDNFTRTEENEDQKDEEEGEKNKLNVSKKKKSPPHTQVIVFDFFS